MAVAGSLTYDTKIDTSGYQRGIDNIKGTTKSAMGQIRNIVAGLGIDRIISSAMNTISSSIDGAVSRIDILNNFPKVMSNLGIGTKDATKAINELSENLQGIPTALDDAALSVQRFTSKNNDVNKSVDIFTAVNNALLAGGASADIQSSALEQLSQSYAKGKMDMIEWRSIQTAMPAQLKQVASAMGLTTDELGEMLRAGDNTEQVFDEFINTIIRLNKEGSEEFLSFEEQARNSTGGINTSIKNMKTAITRGVADVISAFDELLKDNGLGGISGVLASIGKQAEDILGEVAKAIKKIDFKKLIKSLKTLLPLVEGLVAGWLSYIAVMKAIEIATSVKKFTSFAKTILSLIKDVKTLRDAMALLNLTFNANPVALLITAAVTLGTVMVALGNKTDKYTEKLNKQKEAVNEVRNSQKEMNEEAQKSVSQGMSELSYYENLYYQLQQLVDENGKVKSGYEERVNFIKTQLADGLGLEIDLVDGVIKNYNELSKTFNEVLEKKRAMVTLNAQEEQYTEAIKNQADAYKKLSEYSAQLEKSRKELNELEEEYNRLREKDRKNEGFTQEELNTYRNARKRIDDLKTQVEEETKLYNKQVKAVKEYTTDIAIYEDNLEKFRAGNYSEMTQYSKNYLSNLKLDSGSQLEVLSEQIKQEEEKLKFLKDLKKQNNTDIYDEQILASQKRLEELNSSFENEKNAITTGNSQNLQAWLLGLQNTVSQISGRQIEFKDLGNGMVQTFIDGVKQGEPIAYSNMEKFGNNLVKELDKKSNAKKSAESILDGVIEGINNSKKWSVILGSVNSLSDKIVDAFNESLDINSPSGVFEYWSEFIPDGVAVGIEKNTKKAVKAIDYMNKEIVDKVKNSVALETGNINANLKSKSLLNNNNTIQINATFSGEVDMDGDKVGKIITPAISRTLKAGGLK